MRSARRRPHSRGPLIWEDDVGDGGAPDRDLLGEATPSERVAFFPAASGKARAGGVSLGPLPYRFALVTSLEYRLGRGRAGGTENFPPLLASLLFIEFKEFEVSGGGVAGSPGLAPGRGVQAQRRVPFGPASERPGRARARPQSATLPLAGEVRARGAGAVLPRGDRAGWGSAFRCGAPHAGLENFGAVPPGVWGAGGAVEHIGHPRRLQFGEAGQERFP